MTRKTSRTGKRSQKTPGRSPVPSLFDALPVSVLGHRLRIDRTGAKLGITGYSAEVSGFRVAVWTQAEGSGRWIGTLYHQATSSTILASPWRSSQHEAARSLGKKMQELADLLAPLFRKPPIQRVRLKEKSRGALPPMRSGKRVVGGGSSKRPKERHREEEE